METVKSSTSATLLYVERPILNFVRYVELLEQALRATRHQSLSLSWDNDDFVQFDIDGSRVVLGYCDMHDAARRADGRIPDCYATALVITAGPGEATGLPDHIARHARTFCLSLIERISLLHQPDLVLWRNLAGCCTADHFDALVDLALELRPANIRQDMRINEIMETPVALSAEAVLEEALAGDYFETAYAGVAEAKPAMPAAIKPSLPQARQPADRGVASGAPASLLPGQPAPLFAAANDTPDLPHPMAAELVRIRSALYPQAQTQMPAEDAAAPEQPSTVQRLTVYALSASLMMVSLPIGGAMFAYNIFGREDTKMTARVLTLTAITLGLSRAIFGIHLQQLI